MLATDVAPNRLAAAKKAAGTFLDALPDQVRVGAVAFNQKADVLQSPTRDHDAVREAIAGDQGPPARPPPATRSRPRSPRITGKAPAAIVLLSDGKSVRGSDPLAAAQAAKARKIPIYTVALGTANGHDQRRRSPCRPTRRRSRDIAQITGGRAFTAERRRVARPGLQAPRLTGRDREAASAR